MIEVDYTFEKVSDNDLDEIESLSKEKDGNKNLTNNFIRHWYFKNPSHSFSIWKVIVNDKIEGFATSNNFKYIINNELLKVAMPQNVLTSRRIRGKGFFNKLYFKTESHNINENGITAFLTFTNELSTPIFLNKFSYARGKCPLVIFNLFSLNSFFKKKNFVRLNSIDEIENVFFKDSFHFNNAMYKDEEYYRWRYANYERKVIHVIKVFAADTKGFAILKEEKKKGIKFLIVMDIICVNKNNMPDVIQACFNYVSRNFYFGSMIFDLPDYSIKKNLLQLRFHNRFNFLVKGKDVQFTKTLSGLDFNMFFADLDIV